MSDLVVWFVLPRMRRRRKSFAILHLICSKPSYYACCEGLCRGFYFDQSQQVKRPRNPSILQTKPTLY